MYKTHYVQIHLNKHKKRVRENGKVVHSLTTIVAPKDRAPYIVGSSFSKKTNLAIQNSSKKSREYSFSREKVRDLFEQLMEQEALELPEPRHTNRLGLTNDPGYYPYHQLINHSMGGLFCPKRYNHTI